MVVARGGEEKKESQQGQREASDVLAPERMEVIREDTQDGRDH